MRTTGATRRRGGRSRSGREYHPGGGGPRSADEFQSGISERHGRDAPEVGERFDVVLAMEVIEHVVDHRLFLQTCAALARPDGLVILSTINRTLKSWLQAIVLGEYVLGLLPRGAHHWDRFVTPDEIRDEMARSGMRITDVSGVTMNLGTRAMQLSAKTGVNYILTARR
ncbi:MAG TPA: bifunctional 2-polyprenyl-6-hydroxyphenol methylase/3-demethylubiquinol 3-O-methyltransferase UbiG [Arthrobacter sp.]|nr:bifunctional 2-polyprenyl-6-hydroxyphenol methylase/3-demethylubiquinol 3-O-methyltransferase UbiG [Arthrobacter sp.]